MIQKNRLRLSVSAFACTSMCIEDNLDFFSHDFADTIHIDLMDGVCVPMQGVSWETVDVLDHQSSLPLDFHLMVADQKDVLQKVLAYGRIDTITITLETITKKEMDWLLDMIKDHGIRRAVAIWPNTDFCQLVSALPKIEEITMMSTFPGVFDSQFLLTSFDRVSQLKQYVSDYDISLAVDGSMNLNRASRMVELGASRIIVGRSFFDATERSRLISYANSKRFREPSFV